jgi:5-methylcytosine-specific restriction endonuclease McrA
MKYKTCFICESRLPATPEYFNRDASRSDGLHPYCKECRSKKRAERYANSPDLRAKAQKRANDWFYENRERARVNRKKQYWKDPESAIEDVRQWREENPERYRKNNRNKWQRMTEEQKNNARAYVRNRRAMIKNSDGEHTAEEVQERLEEQGYMCFYCSHPLEDDYHIDHYYPLSKGGSNNIDNLVASCPTCNLSKHDKDPREFMAEIGRTYI